MPRLGTLKARHSVNNFWSASVSNYIPLWWKQILTELMQTIILPPKAKILLKVFCILEELSRGEKINTFILLYKTVLHQSTENHRSHKNSFPEHRRETFNYETRHKNSKSPLIHSVTCNQLWFDLHQPFYGFPSSFFSESPNFLSSLLILTLTETCIHKHLRESPIWIWLQILSKTQNCGWQKT